MAAKPKGPSRTPAKVGPSPKDVAAASALLAQRATGATKTEAVGRGQVRKGVGGTTAFNSRGGVDEDAILAAAEMPDPNFAARQAAAIANQKAKAAPSSEPVDQTMSRLISDELTPKPLYGMTSLTEGFNRQNRKLDANDEMIKKSQASIQNNRVASRAAETPASPASPAAPAASNVPSNNMMNKVMASQADNSAAPASSGPPSNNMMNKVMSSQSEKAQAPAAMSEDRIQSLYKKATGTSFNPKSKADRAALAEIQAVMNARPDLADASDTKIALAWYKSKKK